ncbi:MAG: hypothetical protein SOV62_01360, partial [Alloprevotella sp.]|nr:hypothetical protein [Alloprevotella sp.]
FAAHLEITKKLSRKGDREIIVYFADSYSSWQKGAIENANKLIRKYIPKKANFDDFNTKQIANIQKKINRRPTPPWRRGPTASSASPLRLKKSSP